MKSFCHLVLRVAVFICVVALNPLRAADITMEFDQANKLYEEGKFRDAAEAYAKILSSGKCSSPLLFNLGNAQFKAGQVGRAIAAYERAGQLTPRDADLRANLDFARQRVTGPTVRPGPMRRWMSSMTVNEWSLLALFPVWIWFALMIAGQIRPALKPRIRSTLVGAAAASLVCCALLGWVLNVRYNERLVVVTARDAVVRNGPLPESPSKFTAVDGAELQLLDSKDEWFQVSDGATFTGWLKTNVVERVN